MVSPEAVQHGSLDLSECYVSACALTKSAFPIAEEKS